MSLATQLSNLATRIGTEFKAVRTSIGSLTSLASFALPEIQVDTEGQVDTETPLDKIVRRPLLGLQACEILLPP